ncbi:unnamed protein product [Orchesella dallaii]|uniref:Uncharacterized protein n=1 Tax=Orchesella dallaii TaxID=48710 RepID=A0ABP1QVY8_9HEXA
MQALRIIKRLMTPSLKIDVNSNSFGPKISHLIALGGQNENCESAHSCDYPRPRNRLSNLIKIYFDFAYYSCCSPFHFVSDNNDWFVIKTWKPQQFICGILHFLGIFRFFTELRSLVPGTFSQNPVQYFEVLGNGFKIIFKMITIKRLWWNQKEFLSVVNYIEFEKSLPNCDLKLQNKYVVSLICGLYSLMSMVILSGKFILAEPSTWSKTWWNRSLVKDGNYAFLLINRTEYMSPSVPEPNDISPLDYLLAFLLAMGLMERFELL